MKVMITGGRVDAKKLAELLNRELNKYNIQVTVVEEEGLRHVALNIYPRLIKPVKYSPATSQMYNKRLLEWAGIEDIYAYYSTKLRYGVRMRILHWYHFAILNDTLTYIFDRLKEEGIIDGYKIQTAVGVITDRFWREKLSIEYYPQYDPAFLKRKTTPQTRYKNIPIYSDRLKMLGALRKIREALILEHVEPKELPHLEEMILTFTRAKAYYKGIIVPETLNEAKPHIRAWFRLKYGNEAEEMYHSMSEKERDEEHRKLAEWLEKVNPGSSEFDKYLNLWMEEIEHDIQWAIDQYGGYEEVLHERDDAGFPYGLAVSLLRKPFTPDISVEEIRALRKEAKEEYELLEA